MIVYCLDKDHWVHRRFAQGLRRAEGRHYTFSSWEDIKLCLQAYSRDTSADGRFEDIRVLVLNCDKDMLVAGPIPASSLPTGLKAAELGDLQSRSRYLETDLDPTRIVGIRNALGDDVTELYKFPSRRISSIRRFLTYLKPHMLFVAAATASGIVKFLIPLSFPWMLRVVLDDIVLNSARTVEVRSNELLTLAVLLIALNLLWLGATWLRGICTGIAGHRMIRDLRVALFDHLQRLSHHFFAVNQSGAIVARVVNDIVQAQKFIGSALTNVWMDLVLMIVLLLIIVPMHWQLSLVALSLLPIFLVSIRYLSGRIRLSSIEVQQRVEMLSGDLQEKVAGIGIIKSFTREDVELASFQTQSNKLYSKILQSVRYATLNEMMVGLVVMTSPVLVVWYGGHLIMRGELTVGQLTQFLLYLSMFYAPLQRLSDLSRDITSSVASIERVFEYFDTMPHVAEKPNATRLSKPAGQITFDHVTFAYEPDKPVIHDVCLQIEAGQTVALVGPSGSGKSTVANLVPRFYDPTSGVIHLDRYDLRDLSLDSLRCNIGIVNQETILFSGTIRENLLLARPDAGPNDLTRALDAANARGFVEKLSEGLWTEIGERGIKLSGGQRQRLALARAFLKDPRILILDEATSALDSRSEHLIQESLARLLDGRTSIIIAHRLSTILGADAVAVLDRGRVVQFGNHSSLVKEGGLYAQMFAEAE